MINVISLISHRLSFWRSDARVVASFILGFGLSVILATRYISFARVVGSPVQIVEMFVLAGSADYVMPGILLGALLLVSNAPFVYESTPYEILRTGNKKWICASTAYLIVCCTMYYLAIALAFAVMAVAGGSVSIDDQWSTAINMLAEGNAQFEISNFKLSFSFPDYIHSLTPYGAFLRTFFFNGLYALILAMCIFSVNLFASVNCGWIPAFAIHISGTVILKNNWLRVNLGKLSLLECAMPAYHFEKGMSPLHALILLTVPTTLLIILCIRFSHLLNPCPKSQL